MDNFDANAIRGETTISGETNKPGILKLLDGLATYVTDTCVNPELVKMQNQIDNNSMENQQVKSYVLALEERLAKLETENNSLRGQLETINAANAANSQLAATKKKRHFFR